MRRKQIILLVASTAIFFEALDIAILNLAIPLMQRQFQLDAETIQWVQTVYVLFYGGFLVIGGKLCDTVGRKNIFLAGAGLFLCTSLGAGLSNSFIMLTAFRALQGLAAAMVMPQLYQSLPIHLLNQLNGTALSASSVPLQLLALVVAWHWVVL